MEFGSNVVNQTKSMIERIDRNRAMRETGEQIASEVIALLHDHLMSIPDSQTDLVSQTVIKAIRSHLDDLLSKPAAQSSMPHGRQQKLVTKSAGPEIEETDVLRAIETANWIIENAEFIPSKGREFADSIAEKAESIRESVVDRDSVSPGQLEALENMEAGLARWLR